MDKSSRVGRLTLYLSLATLFLTGVVLGIAPFLANNLTEQRGLKVMIGSVSYAITYRSYRKAYEDADLVVLGRVVSVNNDSKYRELRNGTWVTIEDSKPPGPTASKHVFTFPVLEVERVIKGKLSSKTVTIIQGGVGIDEEKGIAYIILEDPPLEVGERVILFLHKSKDEDYPSTYSYPGPFGRFEIIDGKVYSMMYEAPELKLLEKYGIPEQQRIEQAAILSITDYANVNGITLEAFIETLTAP